MEDSSDRRRYRRFETAFNVRISKVEPRDNMREINSTIAKALNLSGGGVFLSTAGQIDLGDVVHMYFLKPKSFEFFDGTGRVVRKSRNLTDHSGIAVEFLNLPETESKFIDYQLHRPDLY